MYTQCISCGMRRAYHLQAFRMSVITQFMEKLKKRTSSRGARCSNGIFPLHLTYHHFPDHVLSIPCQKIAITKLHVSTTPAIKPKKMKESHYMRKEWDAGLRIFSLPQTIPHTENLLRGQKQRHLHSVNSSLFYCF
jgi:hypothetical protein